MPTSQKWHLILTNGESTQLDGVAELESDGDSFTFKNEAGDVVCFVDRASLVLAKRTDLSGSKR